MAVLSDMSTKGGTLDSGALYVVLWASCLSLLINSLPNVYMHLNFFSILSGVAHILTEEGGVSDLEVIQVKI